MTDIEKPIEAECSTCYCVCVDAGGAHEAACVYSIWTTNDAAEAEKRRLNESGQSLGCHGDSAYVVAVPINISRDEWIE